METLQSRAPLTTELKKPESRARTSESNYVDLGSVAENTADGTKTVRVTFTGEGNQLAIFKWRGDEISSKWTDAEVEKDFTDSVSSERTGTDSGESTKRAGTGLTIESVAGETEERDYTDMYLNSRCEPDAEAHYITTHEIQLTELDHDVDGELGRGSCWDYDDDHLVYSFVDYASFVSGSGAGETDTATDHRDRRKGKSSHAPRLGDTGAVASTESEFCESDKPASSEGSPEKASRNDGGGGGDETGSGTEAGRIRLSIRTCSRAVCGNGVGRYRSFIPAPGRVHLASKRKGRDVNECSSCASSSVSEPDDADKEVRTLTAKTFRSLACPYFDAIDLRTSSESSVSEREDGTGTALGFNTDLVGTAEPVRNDAETSSGEAGSPTRAGDAPGVFESTSEPESDDGCKKGVFASSLLQNVISKRMQSEHERKAGPQRLASGPEAPGDAPGAEMGTEAGASNTQAPVARSRNSAFQNWKEGEETEEEDKKKQNGTKTSHLYVLPEPDKLPFRARHEPGDLEKASERPTEVEIRIRERKTEPFSIAELLTPNVAKPGADPKSRALSVPERVPHFTVRDVRENKCKLQTPIHHVRDVRKLVKSSYRFVSLDSGESKPAAPVTVKKEPDKTGPAAPMVIKCQSVNTKRLERESGESGPTKGRASPKRTGRGESARRAPCARQMVAETETKPVRKPDSALTNRTALEKLQAAVKTMEELYVFDRNEWRRKTEAPQPVTDSHVLSMIKTGSDEIAKESPNVKAVSHVQTETFKSFGSSKSFRSPASIQQERTAKTPLRLKVSPSSPKSEERSERPPDSENYLTIPSRLEELKPAPAVQHRPPPARPPLQRSPVVTESWSPESPPGTVYCHAVPPPPLLCLAPPLECPTLGTQRKLLLDPVTGLCYLVDAPVPLQPAAQRLYCPESGQYVDVPLCGTPVSPVTLSPAAAYAPAYVVYPPALLPVPSEGEGPGGGTCVTPRMSSATPVISITAQQGPRIVAPPKFDGTTMSFVVEHR